MKHTQKQLLEAGLKAFGAVQVPSRSGKVTAWAHVKFGSKFYFVGNAGSLRFGRCYSDAHMSSYKQKFLDLGTKALTPDTDAMLREIDNG